MSEKFFDNILLSVTAFNFFVVVWRHRLLSSEIFENCLKMFVGPLEKFWRIFGNLRKVVRNIEKKVVVRILYNIQKIA